MSEQVSIVKHNEVYSRIDCEPSVRMELSENFTFQVPGYKWMPSYRSGMRDGKIRIFNAMTGLLYAGLNEDVEEFCKQRGYELAIDREFDKTEFSIVEAETFIKSLNIPSDKTPREHQVQAFVTGVRDGRALFLSPTASGKSLMIYLLLRYYDLPALVIVPTINLVHQLASDFESYGYPTKIQKIHGGQFGVINEKIVVTTWQSIYKRSRQWFEKFDVVIGDEAHNFQAKSLTAIMTKLDKCRFRFGFTGTLDGTKTHQMVLKGLFGPIKRVATTNDLIKKGYISTLEIKIIILRYLDETRQMVSKLKYHDEVDFIVNSRARNNFIKNLALSLKGNSIVMFHFVDKHGKPLYDLINNAANGRKVYYVAGSVPGEDREEIRRIVETEKDAIIVASDGTFSTGVNIPSIENIIGVNLGKSMIRLLQGIGRGLRKTDIHTHCTYYDISDDLSWKNKINHTLRHLYERIKIYTSEEFNYKIYRIGINE